MDVNHALDLLARGGSPGFPSYSEHLDAFERDRERFLPDIGDLMKLYDIGYDDFVALMRDLKTMRAQVDALKVENRRIAFYGVGGRFETLYPTMRDILAGAAEVMLCDSAASKHGQIKHGLTVLSPDEMVRAKPDTVLVASVHYKEIVLGLRRLAREHSTHFDIALLD